LIEGFPLRVLFPLGDFAMLLPGDRPLVAESHGRAIGVWDQRPRQPVHVQAEVVQAAQINIGRDRAGLEDPQHQFSGSINNGSRQQGAERPVLGYTQPAFPIRPLLGLGQRFHRLLPGACGQAVVCASQIGFGDLEIEHWLALSLVPGLEDLLASSGLDVPRLVRLPVVLSTQ
jgi:hypothetical protein